MPVKNTMTLGEFRTQTQHLPDEIGLLIMGYRNEKPEALCEIKTEEVEEEEHDAAFFDILAEGEKGETVLVLQ